MCASAAYCASKAAVIAMTKCDAIDVSLRTSLFRGMLANFVVVSMHSII